MSITDELRKWVKSLYTPNSAQVKDEAFRIADRIDAEHKKAIHELYGLAEDSILLPKDADGKTIRVGERVQVIGNDPSTVSHMILTDDGWRVFVKYDGMLGTGSGTPEYIRHVKPDSWERIIRDAQGDGILNQIDGRPSDFEALVERCKRLAGEDA